VIGVWHSQATIQTYFVAMGCGSLMCVYVYRVFVQEFVLHARTEFCDGVAASGELVTLPLLCAISLYGPVILRAYVFRKDI
jgi:hypothetical protein